MSSPAGVSHTRVLVGLAAGAAAGCLANYLCGDDAGLKERLAWVVRNVSKPVGDIFLNLLFMAIVPLVFASLAVGVTRLGGGAGVGRVGLRTVAYFVVTTACAATIGLTLVNVVRPGDQLRPEKRDELMAYYGLEAKAKTAGAAFGVETLTNVVPKNPLKSFAEKDMLAIIFTAFVVGVALTRIDPEKARLMVTFLEAVNQITDFIINLAMRIAPVAVFCLLFSTTALFGVELLKALGAFMLTVLGGLAVHQFVVLPVLVGTLGGMNPVLFFRKARGTMATAFSTSSSSATLPTAMRCAEEELGVPPAVSRFVLPLSASMNHNGTALFEGVTALFLAQAFGVDLAFPQQLIVLVLCVLTATGMAGVPGGSLPLIGMVIATGSGGRVDPAAIGIVLGVDRLLDMCRTTVNVTADLTTAVFSLSGSPSCVRNQNFPFASVTPWPARNQRQIAARHFPREAKPAFLHPEAKLRRVGHDT